MERSILSLDNMIPAFLLELAHVTRARPGPMVGLLRSPTVTSFHLNGFFGVV